MEGTELALYEAKERRRLRLEAEQKAKEMEDAAMEDMMMGIEEYESDAEDEPNGKIVLLFITVENLLKKYDNF